MHNPNKQAASFGTGNVIQVARSSAVLLLYIGIVLFGGVAGFLTGSYISKAFWPRWDSEPLPQAPSLITEILFVDYRIPIGVPTSDQVLVATHEGQLYSLLQNNWHPVESLPSGSRVITVTKVNNSIVAVTDDDAQYQLEGFAWIPQTENDEATPLRNQNQCAAEGREQPPVKRKVIDSKGVVLTHSISESSRCHILTEDGNLYVWTRNDSAFDSLPIMAIGAFLGVIVSIWALAAINIIRR